MKISLLAICYSSLFSPNVQELPFLSVEASAFSLLLSQLFTPLPTFHVALIFLLLPCSFKLVCLTVIKMFHQDSDATWGLSL